MQRPEQNLYLMPFEAAVDTQLGARPTGHTPSNLYSCVFEK